MTLLFNGYPPRFITHHFKRFFYNIMLYQSSTAINCWSATMVTPVMVYTSGIQRREIRIVVVPY